LQTYKLSLPSSSEDERRSNNDAERDRRNLIKTPNSSRYPGMPEVRRAFNSPHPGKYLGRLDISVGPSGVKRTARPHQKPIIYDMHKSHIVMGILSECDGIPPIGLIDHAISRARYPELRGHLLKIRDDLSSWEPYRAEYAWTPREIIRECLAKGPSFYDEYKSAKREGMYRGMGARDPITGQYIYGPPNRLYWDGPNSWFDMRFSIFWDLGSDDHNYMFSEGSDNTLVDSDMIETFKVSVLSVLPDSMEIEDSISDLFKVSSAKSFDPTQPFSKRKPEWLELYGDSVIDEGPAIPKVKGVLIPKCASETRDGVTISPTTKRLLTRCGSAISRMIQVGPYRKRHPTGMDYDQVDSKLSHLADKYRWFLCLDFEKIGLTLPTYIITSVLECCYDVSKYDPFLEAIDFFKGLEYHNGSEYLKLLRGYCLGLFNEGMTLVQLALHHMLCSDLGSDYDGMFLNDDAVVGFETKDDAMAYAEQDSVNCLALGIPRKESKSFLSYANFVFCEEYYRDGMLLDKTCLRMCAYNACFYMPTIRLAKELYSSIAMSMGLDLEVLASLIEHWGYEYYEDEYLKPYEFGGWYHVYGMGYNLCCNLYTNSFDEYWANKALNLTIKHRGKVGKRPTQPLSRVIRAERVPSDETLMWKPLTKIEDLFGDARAISFYRGQTDTGKDNSDFFSYIQYKKRKDFFNKHRMEIPPTSLIEDLVADGYMPPFTGIKTEPLGDHIEFQFDKVTEFAYNDACLVLDLMKLGVYYNHPQLNQIDKIDAESTVLQYLVNENPIVPLRGLRSIEPTESNLKLVNFCYKNYSCIPKIECSSRVLPFMAAWGSKLDDRIMDIIEDLFCPQNITELREIMEALHKLISIKEPSEEVLEPQEVLKTEPEQPRSRLILVRKSQANSLEYGGSAIDPSSLQTMSFAAGSTDEQIWAACSSLNVFPLGLTPLEEEEPDDNIIDPFGCETSGDY
jgi:hypothetical protein